MKLIEDHAFQRPEQLGGALVSEHQRDLLGRRQQNVGRQDQLARPARLRRIAGARLQPNGQPHLLDRRGEVPRDVGGERFQRRDIERVNARGGRTRERAAREIDEARQEAGQGLAAAGRRDQQRVAPGRHRVEQRQLVRAGCPATGGEPAGKGFRKPRIACGRLCGDGLQLRPRAHLPLLSPLIASP